MAPLRRIHISRAQLGLAHDSRVALSPEQSRYLVSVLRMSAGDPLEVFDGEGERFSARLALDEHGNTGLQLGEKIETAKGARTLEVTLAQALAKADKLELVIQKATELGCTRIIPFAAERCVVKLDEDRGQAKLLRWRKIAEEAARQCGRADVPQLDAPVRWDDLFARLEREPALRAIALDPLATSLRLGEASRGAEKILLAVGPEGGFSPEELLRAEQHGFVRASLGQLILRTETAGLAALAVVQHLAGQLG